MLSADGDVGPGRLLQPLTVDFEQELDPLQPALRILRQLEPLRTATPWITPDDWAHPEFKSRLSSFPIAFKFNI